MKLNWQKEEQYDYVNALDYHALAFEFLRRNKSYKADYNEYLAILNEVEKDKDPESENWTKQDTRLWVLSPEIEEHETLDDWRKRVYLSNVDPIEKPLHIAYGEKWGLRNAFPNPASYAQKIVRFLPPILAPLEPSFEEVKNCYEETEPYAPITQRPETAVLIFDLLSNLPKQFSKAKTMLTERQEKLRGYGEEIQDNGRTFYKTRNIKNVAKNLLRAFDGNASGASNIDIGNIIYATYPQGAEHGYNRSQTAYNAIKKAKTYVEIRYRLIPFVESDF